MFIEADKYAEILRVMPIPCVDLLVVDEAGRVLLLLRRNHPARGKWWFPGGRVHHGELRRDASRRKLLQECGLQANEPRELGTYDVLLEHPAIGGISHAVTTVYRVDVFPGTVVLDEQSLNYRWATAAELAAGEIDPFVASITAQFLGRGERGGAGREQRHI